VETTPLAIPIFLGGFRDPGRMELISLTERTTRDWQGNETQLFDFVPHRRIAVQASIALLKDALVQKKHRSLRRVCRTTHPEASGP
jgi:hypothetical protein